MRNGLIGYFCIILYDQWMILQTVNFSDLLCVVFGFRVRTSQKCIFLFFVCSLILTEINASPEGNNSNKRRLAWMAKSLMAAGVDVKFPDEE